MSSPSNQFTPTSMYNNSGQTDLLTGLKNAAGDKANDVLSYLMSGGLGKSVSGVGQSSIGQGGSPLDWLMSGGAGRAITGQGG